MTERVSASPLVKYQVRHIGPDLGVYLAAEVDAACSQLREERDTVRAMDRPSPLFAGRTLLDDELADAVAYPERASVETIALLARELTQRRAAMDRPSETPSKEQLK